MANKFYRVVISNSDIGKASSIVSAKNSDEALDKVLEACNSYLEGSNISLDANFSIYEINPNNGIIYSDINQLRNDEESPDYNGTTLLKERLIMSKKEMFLEHGLISQVFMSRNKEPEDVCIDVEYRVIEKPFKYSKFIS